MRPPRECISPNAYPLSHHQRPGCSSQERVLPCHVSAAPGRAPGRPHELYAVDPIQQAAHPWPDVYLQQLHLLRQQGGGCLPPYHTPAGGEPDTLASSPLARQGPRPGPRPGKPLRVWRPERRGDLSPSLSTCPPPGPVWGALGTRSRVSLTWWEEGAGFGLPAALTLVLGQSPGAFCRCVSLRPAFLGLPVGLWHIPALAGPGGH